MPNEKERMPVPLVYTAEQQRQRDATRAKIAARKIAAQKAKEARDQVMSDPRRIEALKRMQDVHIAGERAANDRTRANTPQLREAAKIAYADYQSKLKDDYITNKIKREQLDYARGKRSNSSDIASTHRNPFNPFTNSPAQKLQREIQEQEKYLAKKQNQPTGMKKGGAVKGMAEGGAADEDLMRYRAKMEKQRQKIKLDRAQGKTMFAGQRTFVPSFLQRLHAPGSLAYESVMANGPVRKDKSGNYVPVPESEMSPETLAKRKAADAQHANARRRQEENYVARRNEKAESQKLVNAMQGKAKGGAVKSASSRADGCAVRGKTRA